MMSSEINTIFSTDDNDLTIMQKPDMEDRWHLISAKFLQKLRETAVEELDKYLLQLNQKIHLLFDEEFGNIKSLSDHNEKILHNLSDSSEYDPSETKTISSPVVVLKDILHNKEKTAKNPSKRKTVRNLSPISTSTNVKVHTKLEVEKQDHAEKATKKNGVSKEKVARIPRKTFRNVQHIKRKEPSSSISPDSNFETTSDNESSKSNDSKDSNDSKEYFTTLSTRSRKRTRLMKSGIKETNVCDEHSHKNENKRSKRNRTSNIDYFEGYSDFSSGSSNN